MEQAQTTARRRAIEVYALSNAERRLLLEMLASERCGEDSLDVTELTRSETADVLCDLRMSRWVSPDSVIFTHYGRAVAETLALRLMNRSDGYSC